MSVSITGSRSLSLPSYTVTAPGVSVTHYAAPLAFKHAVELGMPESAAFDALVRAMEKAEPRTLQNAILRVSL